MEEEIMVKMGCKPISTKTNPSDCVAASACAKHHEPATPQTRTMAMKYIIFCIFCIFFFRKMMRKVRSRIPAILLSRATRRFPEIGILCLT